MDETEAVKIAERQLRELEQQYGIGPMNMVLSTEIVRALLARATRPHD